MKTVPDVFDGKNRYWHIAVAIIVFVLALPLHLSAGTVAELYRGRVVLQAESGDKAWYVHPKYLTRFSIASVEDFKTVVKKVGIRISNKDLAKIPSAGFSATSESSLRYRLAGYFLIQVDGRGEAWYVDPDDNVRYTVSADTASALFGVLGTRITDGTLIQIPTSVNLDVPFSSQAPKGIWDLDHSEFCEETSVLMVYRFLQGRAIKTANDAETELQRMKRWEVKRLGHHYDTDIAETAKIASGVYHLKTQLTYNPSAQNLRDIIDTGHPIIVPALGRKLGNRFFKKPGPDYHVFVIRGYTSDHRFIVNDPGTSSGENLYYSESVVTKAMHDYNDGHPETGQKVVLVLSI
ncbi:MAG: C39 family peptidase [Candidatus Kerfeldbacteria bacterium]